MTTSPISELRVRAILRYEHPGAPRRFAVFHAPLFHHLAFATSQSGARVEAPIDRDGIAVFHLAAGRYELTTSRGAPCYTTRVTLLPGKSAAINLACVEP
jgi:hypothetical protein